MANRLDASGDDMLLPDDGSCPCCSGWSEEIPLTLHCESPPDWSMSLSGFIPGTIVAVNGAVHQVRVEIDHAGDGVIMLPADAALDVIASMTGRREP